MVLWKENEMAGSESEVFRDYLDRLLDDINKEAESERSDTAELQQLEQMVADRRAALIKKTREPGESRKRGCFTIGDKDE